MMPTPEEEVYFGFARLECRPPAQRDTYKDQVLAEIQAAKARRIG